jgi:hypothetical protein
MNAPAFGSICLFSVDGIGDWNRPFKHPKQAIEAAVNWISIQESNFGGPFFSARIHWTFIVLDRLVVPVGFFVQHRSKLRSGRTDEVVLGVVTLEFDDGMMIGEALLALCSSAVRASVCSDDGEWSFPVVE